MYGAVIPLIRIFELVNEGGKVMTNQTNTNLGTTRRVSLMVLSLGLIAVTLATQGPLGWKVIFPLLAIYPGIIALTGRDLVYAFVTPVRNRVSRTGTPIQAGI
jgi:hypothetical protein